MDIQQLPDEHRERILAVLVGMNGAFWGLPRKMQVIALLRATRGRDVSNKLIAIAMGVAESFVTKYKQRFQERPETSSHALEGQVPSVRFSIKSKTSSRKKRRPTAP